MPGSAAWPGIRLKTPIANRQRRLARHRQADRRIDRRREREPAREAHPDDADSGCPDAACSWRASAWSHDAIGLVRFWVERDELPRDAERDRRPARSSTSIRHVSRAPVGLARTLSTNPGIATR